MSSELLNGISAVTPANSARFSKGSILNRVDDSKIRFRLFLPMRSSTFRYGVNSYICW